MVVTTAQPGTAGRSQPTAGWWLPPAGVYPSLADTILTRPALQPIYPFSSRFSRTLTLPRTAVRGDGKGHGGYFSVGRKLLMGYGRPLWASIHGIRKAIHGIRKTTLGFHSWDTEDHSELPFMGNGRPLWASIPLYMSKDFQVCMHAELKYERVTHEDVWQI